MVVKIQDVAKLTGLSYDQVYEHIYTKKTLPARKRLGRWEIDQKDFEEWNRKRKLSPESVRPKGVLTVKEVAERVGLTYDQAYDRLVRDRLLFKSGRRVYVKVSDFESWDFKDRIQSTNRESLSVKRDGVPEGDVLRTQNRFTTEHFNRFQPPEPLLEPLTASELNQMRHCMLRMMNGIEGRRSKEKITSRVERLKRDEWIPRLVARMIIMVIQARNDLEYERESLSSTEETAVRAAWEVVREWALSEGLEAALTV